MNSILLTDRAALFVGDSSQLSQVLEPNSVDAIVTDPPAGIGFMGREWDSDKGGREQWIAWLSSVMRAAWVALKPGGHALVWALPRTSHWTATALEEAGFEIRDRVSHLFGTGFPKSLNLGDGRGTALKPACEDWWLVRKPLEGTVAVNVQKWGTGALNIDGCRIGTETVGWGGGGRGAADSGTWNSDTSGLKAGEPRPVQGRWPAHLVLSHLDACVFEGSDAETLDNPVSGHMVCVPGCPVAVLDAQSGPTGAAAPVKGTEPSGASEHGITNARARVPGVFHGDKGGASRFFYVAKPSPSERDLGCEALPVKSGGEITDRTDGSAGLSNPRAGAGRGGGRRNHHPTVKSIALMRWLVRLITPPGGCVLDLFAGSGSTGVAALAEGFEFVGIEREPEYAEIAKARITRALADYPAAKTATSPTVQTSEAA